MIQEVCTEGLQVISRQEARKAKSSCMGRSWEIVTMEKEGELCPWQSQQKGDNVKVRTRYDKDEIFPLQVISLVFLQLVSLVVLTIHPSKVVRPCALHYCHSLFVHFTIDIIYHLPLTLVVLSSITKKGEIVAKMTLLDHDCDFGD